MKEKEKKKHTECTQRIAIKEWYICKAMLTSQANCRRKKTKLEREKRNEKNM